MGSEYLFDTFRRKKNRKEVEERGKVYRRRGECQTTHHPITDGRGTARTDMWTRGEGVSRWIVR
jgi:hypothetical protein